jgi:M6 family metalloprotease-like protein
LHSRAGLCTLLAALVLAVVPRVAGAVPARSAAEPVQQPDGSVIWLRQVGDEWANGLQTLDGYTVVREPTTGAWVFAREAAGGGLEPSPYVVGRDQPVGIRKGLAPSRVPRITPRPHALPQPALAPNLGTQKVLVIFVDFTPSVSAGATPAMLAARFFGPSGSVKAYYEEVSYGAFSLGPAPESQGTANDGIVSVTLGYKHPDTADNIGDANRLITRDALVAADAFVNFAAFDTDANGVIEPTELHIVVIVAGYERSFSNSPCGDSVWGHRWSLYGSVPPPILDGRRVGDNYMQFGEWHCAGSPPGGHLATIGIMAHELGHDLGLPDLYDVDQTSEGIGEWGIMGSGSWNDVALPGDSPAHMDPWSKFFEGWITPTLVTGTRTNEPIGTAAFAADVYQLRGGSPISGEYFLVENRQKVGFDAGLPGAGLLIWHIDAAIDTSDNSDNSHECYPGGPSCAVQHYKVAVVQSDNLYDLEKKLNRGDTGDPWPGVTGKTTFNASSLPGSQLYSGGPSGVTVTAISGSGPTMTATLSVGSQIFADVPLGHWAKGPIETLYKSGVTGGCSIGPLRYCPEASVTREQMAVFLLKAKLGAGYTPPPCSPAPFADVPCSNPFAAWITDLVARGITSGCAAALYCPGRPVTREQMAVFLLKTRGVTPPPCTVAPFADVPCSSPFAPWIKELVNRGISVGCTATTYCPTTPITRAEMAVFLVKMFNLL